MASLFPIIRDTILPSLAEIWHYCRANDPPWSRIRRAEPESIVAPVGIGAIFATRPTIGQNPNTGELVCVWEEFVASNQEPTTQVLRCAIWACASTDNGNTWLPPVVLTDTLSTVSFRFPCVKVPLRGLLGISESRMDFTKALSISPNPFFKSAGLSINLPKGITSLIIYDVGSKLVKRFSRLESGKLTWDGRDEKGEELPKGIYFLKFSKEGLFITKKAILSD